MPKLFFSLKKKEERTTLKSKPQSRSKLQDKMNQILVVNAIMVESL